MVGERKPGGRDDRLIPGLSLYNWTSAVDLVSQWLTLDNVQFEWDDAKDRSNQAKHGVSFSEAQQLFESGVDYLEVFDAKHSETEDRFIAIGPIERGIAIVVYIERNEGLIRIIGARLAIKREQEIEYLSFRPHPTEFELYFDA